MSGDLRDKGLENTGNEGTGAPAGPDFFEYCDSLGFFESMAEVLPPGFFLLFDLAKKIPLSSGYGEALAALKAFMAGEEMPAAGNDALLKRNRILKSAPAGDAMETGRFRYMHELKSLLPGELALDNDLFDRRLLEKTLRIRRFYETHDDRFFPAAFPGGDGEGGAGAMEQKIYILLDRSRSMDQRMRSLYSKYIITEYLRRKRGSRAKFYYRPFDSAPGDLVTARGKTGLAKLMERIILTVTGGTGTNIQKAVEQAIDDIGYDSGMAGCEILLVTDCAGRVDRYGLKKRLGEIKLNILKIGDEYARPNFSEIKAALEKSGIANSGSGINLHDIIHSLDKTDAKNIPPAAKDAHRFALSYMEGLYEDLKAISREFIEIGDMDPPVIHDPGSDDIASLDILTASLEKDAHGAEDLDSIKILYKKCFFFSQYIKFLNSRDKSFSHELELLLARLSSLMKELMKDPELLFHISRMKLPDAEKKNITLAFRDMRKNATAINREIAGKYAEMARRGLMRGGMITPKGGHGFLVMLVLLVLRVVRWIKELIRKVIMPSPPAPLPK